MSALFQLLWSIFDDGGRRCEARGDEALQMDGATMDCCACGAQRRLLDRPMA
ncbi:hypothetical protein [Methylocystis rosea]|uniref:hypothetical protein n=1 Tax=Methylocystis rosea TaxID=173366 RepID=UPI0013DE5523|nr:hypothetical protein [Methylocystis rosea]